MGLFGVAVAGLGFAVLLAAGSTGVAAVPILSGALLSSSVMTIGRSILAKLVLNIGRNIVLNIGSKFGYCIGVVTSIKSLKACVACASNYGSTCLNGLTTTLLYTPANA